jgi:FkbM family methyltransferase
MARNTPWRSFQNCLWRQARKATRSRAPGNDASGGSSDPLVFDQIFINGELANLIGRVHEARTIVDLGANVGYASIVFLNAFPDAYVLAVEPDSRNAVLCACNLAPYGNRARLVEAAAWSRSCELMLVRGAFRDGKEWSTQVRPAQPGEMADVKSSGHADSFANVSASRGRYSED